MGPGSCVCTCHTSGQKESPPCSQKPLPQAALCLQPLPHPSSHPHAGCFFQPLHSPRAPACWRATQRLEEAHVPAQVRHAPPPCFCLSPERQTETMSSRTAGGKWIIRCAGQAADRLGIVGILSSMLRTAPWALFPLQLPTPCLSHLLCSHSPSWVWPGSPTKHKQLFPP